MPVAVATPKDGKFDTVKCVSLQIRQPLYEVFSIVGGLP